MNGLYTGTTLFGRGGIGLGEVPLARTRPVVAYSHAACRYRTWMENKYGVRPSQPVVFEPTLLPLRSGYSHDGCHPLGGGGPSKTGLGRGQLIETRGPAMPAPCAA